jgi:phosphatidylserine decarboxylase
LKIDSSGLPFVLAAAVPAVASVLWGPLWLTGVLLVVAVALAAFFRDPERSIPASPTLVLAPADGTVKFAGTASPDSSPPGAWRQVTIFLRLSDVHINRTPVAGRVTRVEYVPGSFLPAYKREAAQNEHSEIWLDAGGTTVVARQVVGVLARRVVCRVKPGETLAAGARIGLMKFGSRMDVFVPASATLAVRPGDRVRGGETVIAKLASPDA